MSDDLLTALGVDPQDVPAWPATTRRRLLGYLQRWREWEAVLACLDVLMEHGVRRVSYLDDRARALLGLGRARQALETINRRHALRRCASSQILEARCRLALGEVRLALEDARRLARERPGMLTVWAFVVEAALSAGDLAEARQAAARLRAVGSEDSRAYLLAMLALSSAAGNTVAASGCAVRLEGTADALEGLPAYLLRRLVAHYRSSGEAHRAVALEAALQVVRDRERAHITEILGGRLRPHAPHTARPPQPRADAGPTHLPGVPVAERTRLAADAHRLFGHTELLAGQAETITAVLRGQDVLTVLPTGGGKSLCYQLPAFLDERGTTLVVSPLIALMKDQVDSLPPRLARAATTINSSLDGDELRRRLARIADGRYRLVYAAPERLRQPMFLHALRRAPVSRLVIDEVHCVSLWGHDFRPDYLFVGRALALLGGPPVLAMTATAPPRVRDDIVHRLSAAEAAGRPHTLVEVATGVGRPNLFLEVIHTPNQDAKLCALLAVCAAEEGSGIVYVGSRDRSEQLAALLRQRGIAARHYHAGIFDSGERAARQDAFMAGDVRVMVATIAFGMGIDKADIRFIVHYDPPSSLEAYWQEAGRAGRDGLPSRCVLFHAPGDRGTLTRRANLDRIGIGELRDAYRAVCKLLGQRPFGAVALPDLCREVGCDDTRVRVALSLLEEAGHLRRHQDTPRLTVLRWRREPHVGTPLATLWSSAGLAAAGTVEVNLTRLAERAGLDPVTLEAQLCTWADAGYLTVRHTGRDLLLERLPPPEDAKDRVQALLDEYGALQTQRVMEVVAYARTRRCRSGHISAYLSGWGAARCQSCDSCCPDHPLRRHVPPALPGECQQAACVLSAVETHGWGRQSLIGILRAETRAPQSATGLAAWGALTFRSRTAVRDLVARLEAADLLRPRTLDHGGVVLELTPAGRRALARPTLLASVAGDAPATESDASGQNRARQDDVRPLRTVQMGQSARASQASSAKARW